MLVSGFPGRWLWPTRIHALVIKYIRLYHSFHSRINDLLSLYFPTLACILRLILFFFYAKRPYRTFVCSVYLLPSETSMAFFLVGGWVGGWKYSLRLILYLQPNHSEQNDSCCVLRAFTLEFSWWWKKVSTWHNRTNHRWFLECLSLGSQRKVNQSLSSDGQFGMSFLGTVSHHVP